MINGHGMASQGPVHYHPTVYDYGAPTPHAPIATTPTTTTHAPMRPTLDVYHHHHQQQQPLHHPHHPVTHHSPFPQHEVISGAFHHPHTPELATTPMHHHQGIPQHANPMLAATGYYVAPQHQTPYVQHYASTPAALASSAGTLKRKMSNSSVATTSTTPVSSLGTPAAATGAQSQDQLCDVCHHPDPVLCATACGHLFHSRCVHVWPLTQCPVCDAALAHVGLVRIDMNEVVNSRSGKWTRAEEKFIEIILQEFDRCSFPLANGTPVRLVLAKLLNCSTMRLSKKFQKNALGKRTFRIPKPIKGTKAMEFNREDHVLRQKEFSRLELIFRHELVETFRRENNTDEGSHVETQNLRKAVRQFWVVNFLKFAITVGQPVEGLDVSDAKKRKRALQLIRDGQFGELFEWHAPATSIIGADCTACEYPRESAPGVSPGYHPTPSQNHWPAHTTPTATATMGYAPSNEDHDDLIHHHPIKKQRTPESFARLQIHCDIPALTFDPAGGDAQQQQQCDYPGMPPYNEQYSSGAYTQEAYASQYSPSFKPEKSSVVYDDSVHSPHEYHHPVQPHPLVDRSVMPMTGYRPTPGSSTVHQSTTDVAVYTSLAEPTAPPTEAWDGLLEEISEPTPAGMDPSLQAWSNLHMM